MNLPIEIVENIIDIVFYNKDTLTLTNFKNTHIYFDNYITKKCKKSNQIDKGMKNFILTTIQNYKRKCIICQRYICDYNLEKIDKSNLFIVRNRLRYMNPDIISLDSLYKIMIPNKLSENLYVCNTYSCIDNPMYITYKNKFAGGYYNELDRHFYLKYRNIKCQNIFLYRLCKRYLFELFCSNQNDYITIKEFLDKILI